MLLDARLSGNPTRSPRRPLKESLTLPLTEVSLPTVGKTTITKLYKPFLGCLGVLGHPGRYPSGWHLYKTKTPLTITLPDCSNEELLGILVRRIHNKLMNNMKVEGGIVGLYSRILVRKVGHGRARKNFRNVHELQNAFFNVVMVCVLSAWAVQVLTRLPQIDRGQSERPSLRRGSGAERELHPGQRELERSASVAWGLLVGDG